MVSKPDDNVRQVFDSSTLINFVLSLSGKILQTWMSFDQLIVSKADDMAMLSMVNSSFYVFYMAYHPSVGSDNV